MPPHTTHAAWQLLTRRAASRAFCAVGAYTYSDYRCVATASLLHTCQCAHTLPPSCGMAADTTTPLKPSRAAEPTPHL